MDRVVKAFQEVRREDFLPPEVSSKAGWDSPLPIGFSQTNSQPTTVRLMLEWLDIEPGNKILDVGSGSGWTTALLANLTGPSGLVYAVEIVPELARFGEENCRKADIENTQFHIARDCYGLQRYAPYDRILVSAAARKVPEDLITQLALGGKMVIPVNHDVLEIEKAPDGRLDIFPHAGFAFVPLIKPI